MTTETWIKIHTPVGYEHYEISTLGRVRRTDTGALRSPGPSSQSPYHKNISLFRDNQEKGFSVSRLVGLNYLPLTGGFILDKHEDLPPDLVNSLDNLYVGTQSQNIKQAYDTGRKQATGARGEKNGLAKLTEEQVREIRRIWASHKHPTRRQLGVQFGVSPGTIKNIVLNRQWRHVL